MFTCPFLNGLNGLSERGWLSAVKLAVKCNRQEYVFWGAGMKEKKCQLSCSKSGPCSCLRRRI